MITKNDIILLLTDLEKIGVEINKSLYVDVSKTGVTPEIVNFINSNSQLDLHKFYEKIRKSYNEKHSTLYINIVKEIDDVNKVLTTLSALQTQLLLFYMREAEDKEMFLRHSRASEISKVLLNYYMT